MSLQRVLAITLALVAILSLIIFLSARSSSAVQSSTPSSDLLLLSSIVSGILAVVASLKDVVELVEKLHKWRTGEKTPTIVHEYVQSRIKAVALRNRSIMLAKVRVFWIEGVLENSLHGALLLQLGMEYRHDMVDHPWDMILQRSDKMTRTLPEDTDIIDVLDELGGSLLILGQPGSGKTTTLLELTRELLVRAQKDEEHPIPAVFNLSSWAEDRKRIEDWLVDELNTKYDVPTYVGQGWVQADDLVLLLDGLDEVREEYRDECVRAINQFRREHMVNMVVCSRTSDYEMLTTKLSLPGAIMQAPLSQKQIDSYLSSLGDSLYGVRQAIKNDPVLQELAQSPLVLSIIALAYEGMSIQDIKPTTLEETRKRLFEMYIQRMFQHRKPSNKWGKAKIIEGMTWLSSLMNENAQTIFHIEHLQPASLSRPMVRRLYTWIVLIMLLSLVGGSLGLSTGLALKAISGSVLRGSIGGILYGLVGCLGISIAISANYQLKYRVALGGLFGAAIAATIWTAIDNLLIGGAVGGIVGISTVFAYRRIGDSSNVASLSDSISVINTARKRLGWSWRTGTIGFIKRLPFGLVFGFAGGLTTGFIYGWVFGLATATVFCLTFAIAGAISYGMIDINIGLAAKPNEGIHRSTENAIRFGLISGLWMGIAIGFLGALLTDIRMGLILGSSFMVTGFVVGGSIAGGLSVIKHYTLRVLLFLYENVPIRYARFLNQGVYHIFLRSVGGGYIFVHRLLLEHFASTNHFPNARRLKKDTILQVAEEGK